MGSEGQAKYLAQMEVYNLINSGEVNLIAAIGDRAIPGLAKVLEMGRYWEKTLAISALRYIGSSKALRLLKKVMHSPEMGLRKEAVIAVEGLDGKGIDSELENVAKRDIPYVASIANRVLETRKSRPPAEKKKFRIPKSGKGRGHPDNFGNLKPVGRGIIAR